MLRQFAVDFPERSRHCTSLLLLGTFLCRKQWQPQSSKNLDGRFRLRGIAEGFCIHSGQLLRPAEYSKHRVTIIRKSFCESGEGVRLPRERGCLWGSPETSGKSGELPGKSGKLPGKPWIALKFHSERTSGEVAKKLPGKFGELPGKSGDLPEARGSLTPSQRLAKFVSKQRNGGYFLVPPLGYWACCFQCPSV